MADSVTAVDYLNEQAALEREAREVMPYEPDACTFPQLLRQLVFACLTCLRQNGGQNVGVCYSCLIQCHLAHELVEMFSKRNFACDCGTQRMAKGKACALRYGKLPDGEEPRRPRMRTGSILELFSLRERDLPQAEDIESLENVYNHNYQGRFCLCSMVYNPVKETRTMHQCYLGAVCREDWFHQDCILGYKPGVFEKLYPESENKLASLPDPGLEAAADPPLTAADDDDDLVVPHFPRLSSFSEFVCWQCVAAYRDAFDELVNDKAVFTMPHFDGVETAEEWERLHAAYESEEPSAKKRKTENLEPTLYSVFLRDDFKTHLTKLKESLPETSPLARLLTSYDFLYKDDPVYQPQEEQSSTSSVASLYELGSSALQSLPTPQAVEGLHAYSVMKEKLRTFFSDFVDQNKVVTAEEVRDFFGQMKNEK